jgi:hypothetical protein
VNRGDKSHEALVKQAEAQIEKFRALRWFSSLVGLAGVVAASALPARELAGRDTGLSVTLTITAAISLVLSTGAAAAWGRWQRERATDLQRRNNDLEMRVRRLNQQLEEASNGARRMELDLRDAQVAPKSERP